MHDAKTLTRCIYCPRPPDGEEHWLPRSFGAFRGNSLLKGRLCTECNARLGRTLDQELIRTGHTGMTRQLLGISGRSGQPSANVFEYKAAQLEKPIEAESASIVPGQLIPIQAVGRNPDGTLKSVQQRTLTIATTEGERVLVFPRAWGAKQLRDAAAARDLLGGKVIRAHAAPPETAAEFVIASLDVIRAVFGSGPIDVYQTKLDAPMGETQYRRVRFNLSPRLLSRDRQGSVPRFPMDVPEDRRRRIRIRRYQRICEQRGMESKTSSSNAMNASSTAPGSKMVLLPTPHVCGLPQRPRAARAASISSRSPRGRSSQALVSSWRRPQAIPVGWLRGHIAHGTARAFLAMPASFRDLTGQAG